MRKLFGYWILSDHEMKLFLGYQRTAFRVHEARRWFNPYDQLRPLIQYFIDGKGHQIETIRAETLRKLGINE